MPRRKNVNEKFSVVLVTCPLEISEKLARVAVDEHVVACANIVPRVKSPLPLERESGERRGVPPYL